MPRLLAPLVDCLDEARRRRPHDPESGQTWDSLLDVLRDESRSPQAQAADALLEQRLQGMRDVFGLTELDLELLVVTLAPEVDGRFGLAFALLQGDPARSRPSVGLALELCGMSPRVIAARQRLAAGAALLRHDLLTVAGDQPLPLRALSLPDRVVAHLMGSDVPDPAATTMAVEAAGVSTPESGVVAKAVADGARLVWVRSGPGSAGLAVAAAAFDQLDVGRLVVDLRRCPRAMPLEQALRAVLRDAGLMRTGLVLSAADALTEADTVGLLAVVEQAAVPVIAVATRSWDPSWLRGLPVVVEAPPVTAGVRERLWREHLGPAVGTHGPGWSDLVSLRLTPEEIAQTARYAGVVASARTEPVSVGGVREAARRLSADLSSARRGRGSATFDDLVLPPQVLGSLHELVDWARHRDGVLGQGPLAGKGDKGRGIAALFSGSPGTGKTLAAHVVAAELGLDLHTVELSSIVDKYIGETEKNLEKVFTEAESLNVLLFFDEADALFGSRSEVRDARDRYANQEVAYLLQRMEQFDGIAVLATNLRGNLDVAFSRRLHFVVHFPDPDPAIRVQLWETHLAALAALDPADPVDVPHLAEVVEVAGGDIRNIVLAAAYAAAAQGVPVGMRHVVNAVVREYRKLGRRLPVPGLVPGQEAAAVLT